MNPKYYKYTTIGLASLIGVGALWWLALVMPMFLNTAENNEPNTLADVPDAWIVGTWSDGQAEAIYHTNAENCTLNMAKHGTGGHGFTLTTTLRCGSESSAEHVTSRSDMESIRFVTEPTDFDFQLPYEGECILNTHYGSPWQHDVVLDTTIICYEMDD